MVTPNEEADIECGGTAPEQIVDYAIVSQNTKAKQNSRSN